MHVVIDQDAINAENRVEDENRNSTEIAEFVRVNLGNHVLS